MNMMARKAIGCFALLAYLGVYAALAAAFGVYLLPLLPNWGELAYFLFAGVLWIVPLRPLFAWMNRDS
jgi:hypothetical protein